jgi:flavin reductase (DIM6/NTAB) family NADH-FMN oxidoreductase RutF
MAASSFTSVSLDPALVSVCVAHTSTTWPALRIMPRLGVSILASDQDLSCRALSSKDAASRFAAVNWSASRDGAVFLRGAALWLECSVHDVFPAGDHDIVLLEIQTIEHFGNVEPLIFHDSHFRALAT